MGLIVSTSDFALVQGVSHTRATLVRWHADPWPVLREWLVWSFVISAALLGAVYLLATISQPDATPLYLPGIHYDARPEHVARVLFRNSLVLALHAMACVAGFIAGSSLPYAAIGRTGVSRWLHDKAGSLAIGFVVCATTFSLLNQAYILGSGAATLAEQFGLSPFVLLLGLLPHALPELVALFLPLAAWLIASRRRQWNELLAATLVTVAIAAPVLVASALVEVYLSPRLLLVLIG